MNPREDINIQSAKLVDPNASLWDETSYLEHFVAFLPLDYIMHVMLPATNKFAKEQGHDKPFTIEELLHVLGLLKMMEVIQLPEQRMYWQTYPEGMFPVLNFGKVMSLHIRRVLECVPALRFRRPRSTST